MWSPCGPRSVVAEMGKRGPNDIAEAFQLVEKVIAEDESGRFFWFQLSNNAIGEEYQRLDVPDGKWGACFDYTCDPVMTFAIGDTPSEAIRAAVAKAEQVAQRAS